MSTFRLFNQYIRIPFLILGLIEASVFYASIFLAAYIRFSGDISYFEIGLGNLQAHAMVFAIGMILTFIGMGMYQARMRYGIKGLMLRMIAAYFFGVLILALLFYVMPKLYLGRGVILLSLTLSFVLIFIIRYLVIKFDSEIFKRRIIILGAGDKALTLSQLRRKTDRVGFLLLGYVHIRGLIDKVDQDKIITLHMPLKDYCINNEVDEIVLAIDDNRNNFPIQELLDCKMSGIEITDLTSFFERESGKVKLELLHPSWLIMNEGFKKGAYTAIIKRLFDVSVSLVMLIITLPFMILTICAIKIEDGLTSPTIYRQIRIGEDGKPYYVLKFRSMRIDAEKGGKAKWADKHDARVTKVGTIIRNIRLDELPQLFNVLKGDMSFVGPRPERPEFVVKLSEIIPYYNERHRVKPGITGWAQIRYPYGASDKDAVEKLQYDLYYIKNYSLFMDFLILLQTAEVIIFSKGAR